MVPDAAPELDKETMEAIIAQAKVEMEALTMSEVDQTIVHERIQCDGCGMAPIAGPRYKCSVCKNFDFCAKCEEYEGHEHAFLKITDPEVVPEVMISAIHEEEEHKSPRKGFKQVARDWVEFAKNFVKRNHGAEDAQKQEAERILADQANELVAIGIGSLEECLAALKMAGGNMDAACNLILNKNI